MKKPFNLFVMLLLIVNIFQVNAQDSNWVEQIVPFEVGTIADLMFADENLGWAVGQDYSNGRMILIHTENAGDDWIQQDVPDINAYLSNIFIIDNERGYVIGTKYDRAVGMYTNDGGTNWELQEFPETSRFMEDLTFSNDSTGWAAGAGDSLAYILKMVDDSTWVESFSLQTEGFFAALDFLDSDYGYAGGTYWTSTFGEPMLYKTSDGGDNWEMVEIPVNTGSINDISFVNRDTGWVVGSSNATNLILQTIDGGRNWTQLDSFDQEQLFFNNSEIRNPGQFSQIVQLDIKKIKERLLAIKAEQSYKEPIPMNNLIHVLKPPLPRPSPHQPAPEPVLIGDFEENRDVKGYVVSKKQIKTIQNSNADQRNELLRNPLDQIIYAYGTDRSDDFNQKPIIFKRSVHFSFLNSMTLEPQDIQMVEGDSVELHLSGIDQYGDDMLVQYPVWTVSGGGSMIEKESGVWFFAEESGDYIITCLDEYSGIEASTQVSIDEGTGTIESFNSKNPLSIEIKPNPASEQISIRFDHKTGGKVWISIIDPEGKEYFSLNKNFGKGSQVIKWSVTDVPNGIYYCKVSSGKLNLVKAVTVLH